MSHRDALLRAARELVVEKGFAATTARDLARVAHVPLGAVSYHFASKDDALILALVDVIAAWVEEPLAAAEAANANGHGAAQQLQAVEASARDRLIERPLEAAAFLEGIALAARRPRVREVLESRLVDSALRLEQLVERSGIAVSGDLHQVAHALVALHDGFVIQTVLGRPPEQSVLILVGTLVDAAVQTQTAAPAQPRL